MPVLDNDTKSFDQDNPIPLSAIPQGAGSRLDADTLRSKRPSDFLLLASTNGDKLSYQSVTVNIIVAAGATGTVSFTWNNTFVNVPAALVGNVVSGSNFAKMLLSLSSVSKTGGTINVFNGTSGSISPNFVVTIFAVGS